MPIPAQKEAELIQEKQEKYYPPMYNVLLLNDDFTPMDFVVMILESVFHMKREKATRIMMQVHQQGRGLCGVYTKDIAATKVSQVTRLAQTNHHPLQCIMEKSE